MTIIIIIRAACVVVGTLKNIILKMLMIDIITRNDRTFSHNYDYVCDYDSDRYVAGGNQALLL